MKKNNLLLSFLILAISFLVTIEISSQVTITSTPVTEAFVDFEYIDTVKASGPGMPYTYSLDESLDGMYINPGTGIISWTPATLTSGGRVVARVTNTLSQYDTQEFFIYVSDSIPPHEDLVAYWKFDETMGTSYEDCIGSNDAGLGRLAPTPVTGKVDGAQEFDNTDNDEGLSILSDPVFNWGVDDPFSIEFWFKKNITDLDSTQVIIGRNDGPQPSVVHWWVGFSDEDYLIFFIRGSGGTGVSVTSTEPITDTDWHHVVAARNPSPSDWIRLYIDNSYEGTASYDGTGPGFVSTNPLSIGWLESHGVDLFEYPFDGSIDEVRIYNDVLSYPDEIGETYNRGLDGKPGLKGGNFAPLFTSVPADTAYEEASYSYTLTANDIESGTITDITIVDMPGWLGFNDVTNTLYGTPDNSDVGSETVTASISDPLYPAVVVQQQFSLHVINTNDPPSIVSTPVLTVNEETLYEYDVNANDIDVGDNLTYTAPVKPGWLSINSSSGLLSGTPPVDDTTSYSVTVRVTDDSASFDEQSFVIDIRNINDPPVITGQPALDVDEDNSRLIGLGDIYYTDSDNSPGELTLTVNDGTNYTHVGNLVTPVSNFHGSIDVPVELSDGEYTDTETLTITVNSVNDLPVITSVPDLIAYENQQYIYLLEAEDNDVEDELTYSSEKKPDWLTFDTTNHVLSGKPDFFDIGTDSVVLEVFDGTASVYLRYALEVMMTNNIPYITSSPDTEVDEDTEYYYSVAYTDDDPGDFVILSYDIKPDWLTLNEDVLSGTPTNDQVGTEPFEIYTVKLRVTDGKQDSTQTFNITVNNINDAPEITGQTDTIYAYAGTSLVIGLSDIIVEDVDNVPGDLSVIVLPGANYINSGDTAKISPSAKGVIYVNVRVTDGELTSVTYNAYVRVYGGTGIHELVNTNNIVTKLYPVPAGESLTFELNPDITELNFELITMQGQTILKHEILSGKDIFKLDVNNVPSGVYIYKFFNRNNYQTGIVTIQK